MTFWVSCTAWSPSSRPASGAGGCWPWRSTRLGGRRRPWAPSSGPAPPWSTSSGSTRAAARRARGGDPAAGPGPAGRGPAAGGHGGPVPTWGWSPTTSVTPRRTSVARRTCRRAWPARRGRGPGGGRARRAAASPRCSAPAWPRPWCATATACRSSRPAPTPRTCSPRHQPGPGLCSWSTSARRPSPWPRRSAEREAFFAGLVDFAARGGLVISLRADRLGELAAHPRFAHLVEKGLYLLGAMSPDAAAQCHRGPGRPGRAAARARVWSTCSCARPRDHPGRCRCSRTCCARPGGAARGTP